MSGESKSGIEMRQMIDAMSEIKISLKHMEGSSQYEPKCFNSWKEYWEDKMSPMVFPSHTERCACCNQDTSPDDFVGSHIIDEKTNNMYIYPLCKSCNDKYGKGKVASPSFFVMRAMCADFLLSEAKIVHPEE